MSWQSARHSIHHAPDGTHFFMRAEEWPFAGTKSGPVRFWIDAERAVEREPQITLIRYLLVGERSSPVLMVLHKIDYTDPKTVHTRHDWTKNPHDFNDFASGETIRAIHRYVFNHPR